MFFGKLGGGRSSARSRIALGLLLCGLLLGMIWALTLIGLAAELMWAHMPWPMR